MPSPIRPTARRFVYKIVYNPVVYKTRRKKPGVTYCYNWL